ncbi:unnamed protein product [Cuscuta europaea]|uniref:DUF4283 domain-containing protein n=1 Tax=Cuscuta europaea TaxID=41803 RepID=A0A9P0ZJ63_CUSEU|nr:unnamed protein product [Cuscuta europaea]
MLSEDFTFDDEAFLKVPIWVKFPNLPLNLWNEEALSMIASKVGVPITTDKVTQEMTNYNFARVLIEVDITLAPCLSLPIRLPSGKIFKQVVVYETFPIFCFHCKSYDHHPFICNELGWNKKDKVRISNDVKKGLNGKVISLTKCGGRDEGKPKLDVVGGKGDEVVAISDLADSALGIDPTELPTGSQILIPNPPGSSPNPPGFQRQPAPAGSAVSSGGSVDDVVAAPDPTGSSDQMAALGRCVSLESELKKDDVVFKCEIIGAKKFKLFVKPFKHVQASVTRVDRFLRLTDDLDKRGLTFTDHCMESLPGFTMKKGEVSFVAKFNNPFHVFFGC